MSVYLKRGSFSRSAIRSLYVTSTLAIWSRPISSGLRSWQGDSTIISFAPMLFILSYIPSPFLPRSPSTRKTGDTFGTTLVHHFFEGSSGFRFGTDMISAGSSISLPAQRRQSFSLLTSGDNRYSDGDLDCF